MFSKVVRTAPRLLQASSRLNHLPAAYKSASTKSEGKVIESAYQPSGHIPNDESYHQIPIRVGGKDHVIDYLDIEQPYPLVPTLEEISIEKKASTEEGGVEQEIEPEFQPKNLEDKCRVWFGEDMPTKYDDQGPERDHVNFPRIPPNPDEQPKTRCYFLPESWFKFFESKTGRTGGYTFMATFGTMLVSKELFVYNENAHIGLPLIIIGTTAIKMYGKQTNDLMTAFLHKSKQGWIDWQDGMNKLLKGHIKELKQIEERSLNPELIYDAKRENLALQQEAEYRRRLMVVFNEVKRKLDYQVAIEEAKKNFTRKHLVNWVIDSVNKSVNADLEKAVLQQSVLDLKILSQKRKNAI